MAPKFWTAKIMVSVLSFSLNLFPWLIFALPLKFTAGVTYHEISERNNKIPPVAGCTFPGCSHIREYPDQFLALIYIIPYCRDPYRRPFSFRPDAPDTGLYGIR